MSVSLGTIKRIFITTKRSESVTTSTLETYESMKGVSQDLSVI